MTDPKWFVNGKETDYFGIYKTIATMNALRLEIGNNIIDVDYNNGNITINDEILEPNSAADIYEPIYARRTRGERYDKTLKRTVPAFIGWYLGWEATRPDGEKYIKVVWVNPDGSCERRDHK